MTAPMMRWAVTLPAPNATLATAQAMATSNAVTAAKRSNSTMVAAVPERTLMVSAMETTRVTVMAIETHRLCASSITAAAARANRQMSTMSGGNAPVEVSGASTNMRTTWKARTTLRPLSRGLRENLFNHDGRGIVHGLAKVGMYQDAMERYQSSIARSPWAAACPSTLTDSRNLV